MSTAPAVTWVGHATAIIEIDGTRIVTDPLFRDRLGPLVRVATPVRPGVAEEIEAVLLSHLHADHADLRSLRRVGPQARVLAPRGAGEWLEANGIANVRELRAGDEAVLGPVRVMATRAVHDPRRHVFGPRAEPIGFVVRGSRSVYFAGDTDVFAAMADLAGSIDLALLPVWGWGPTLGSGHLDPERAAAATALIAPALAVPVHWGTYALARRPPRRTDPAWPAHRFAALVERHVPGVEVRILAPGERTEMPAGRRETVP